MMCRTTRMLSICSMLVVVVVIMTGTMMNVADAFVVGGPFRTTTTSPSRHSLPSSSSALEATAIQFVRGLDETVVPDVKLTRARDGSSGVATFLFNNPNVFDISTQSKGEITGMFLMDEEGELSTTDVNARFANGKPQAIEAVYVMTSPDAWDRFMRFMERYGEDNGLGFRKA